MAAEVDMHDLLMRESLSYRLSHSNVIIDGVDPIDFSRYPYIPEIIDEDAPLITIIKGAQMGFTIACIMKALEWAKRGTMRGIGYYFPTEGEVSDFAKARFGPMMTDNPDIWGRYVEDTDSAALKKIGSTFLYFRGVGQRGSGATLKSTSKLKSIPNDAQVLDEMDEMDPARIGTVKHRMDASQNPMRVTLSTPTLPGYGVDYDYQLSDQRVWMWKCERCNQWTCLDLDYPDCIVEPHGSKDPYYQCSSCHKELTRTTGQWVARKTEVTDHRGYWISQLGAMMKPPAYFINALEEAIEKGEEKEFYNQDLARAYAETDEEITDEMLNGARLNDPKPLRHEGPAVLGCDPGKPNWYTVRVRTSESDSICIDAGRVKSLDELDHIWRKYNCEAGCIDKGYDPSKVAEFCEDHPGCFGVLYVNAKTSSPDWNTKEREVKCGRTKTLDDAHRALVGGRTKYVQLGDFWQKHFVPQMKNLKRAAFVTNERTGDTRAEWVVTGGKKNDHLRHADAYAHLALERVGLAKSIQAVATRAHAQSRGMRRKRSVMTL